MMVDIKIDAEKCKGCSLCVRACPQKIIALSKANMNEKGYYTAEVIDRKKCIACSACARTCPDCCIQIKKNDKKGE